MRDKKRFFGAVWMICGFIFLYLPIIYVVIFSFNEGRSLTHFTGFSLRWYERMFQSRDMREAIYYTVVIAFLATGISTVIGTITSIALSKSRKILREMVLTVNDFPMLNPDIVTAIGLLLLFVSLHIEKGFLTVLLAHIVFCVPYVMLSIFPKLRALDSNYVDAAMDLGATPWQAMLKVIIPQIKSGIFAGAMIAFTMSFDDFVITYFVSGNGIKNISTVVYTMSKRINPSINALSTLIIAVVSVVLILINVIPLIRDVRKEKKDAKNR